MPKGCKLAITPDRTGAIWLACRDGLYQVQSTAQPITAIKLQAVDSASAIGFGKELAEDYPTLFLSGKVGGSEGIFRSTDVGRTWLQVDDDHHHYGWIGVLTGDPRVFGRVYLGSNGRGIIVAEPVQ